MCIQQPLPVWTLPTFLLVVEAVEADHLDDRVEALEEVAAVDLLEEGEQEAAEEAEVRLEVEVVEPHLEEEQVVVLYVNNNDGSGNYEYAYETGNGIQAEERGHLKNAGSANEAESPWSKTEPKKHVVVADSVEVEVEEEMMVNIDLDSLEVVAAAAAAAAVEAEESHSLLALKLGTTTKLC
ncbi:hypothetical protein BDFB_008979 [Asbolus verrucosus]|uniref:Uncharacterized protein n=1 Tax=Asbolus verrucosus TaxID=1661398 RepID=A0A482VFM1_ASBVE|nr:hypothetical protein BDFB_008979 [Asbolus verrucosus]